MNLAKALIVAATAVSGAVSPVFGIDFGNDYTKVATIAGNRIDMVLNAQSKRKTRTAVSLASDLRLFGEHAFLTDGSFTHYPYRFGATNVDNVSAESLLKATNNGDILQVQGPHMDRIMALFDTYHPLVKGDGETVGEVGSTYDLTTLETVTGHYTTHLIDNAKTHLAGGPLELIYSEAQTVAAIPVASSYREREAYSAAIRIGGLTPVGQISSPLAAAVNYANDLSVSKDDELKMEKIFFDLGSHHLQACRVSITSQKDDVEVHVAPVFCRRLAMPVGGHVLDMLIADLAFVRGGLEETSSWTESKLMKTRAALLRAAEKAKMTLSISNETNLSIEGLLNVKITRSDINNLLRDNGIIDAIDYFLDSFPSGDLELVGGGWRVPAIRDTIEKKRTTLNHVNGDEAPAMGANFVAGKTSGLYKLRPIVVRNPTDETITTVVEIKDNNVIANISDYTYITANNCPSRVLTDMSPEPVPLHEDSPSYLCNITFTFPESIPRNTYVPVSFDNLSKDAIRIVSSIGDSIVSVNKIEGIDTQQRLFETDLQNLSGYWDGFVTGRDWWEDKNMVVKFEPKEGVHLEEGALPSTATHNMIAPSPSFKLSVELGVDGSGLATVRKAKTEWEHVRATTSRVDIPKTTVAPTVGEGETDPESSTDESQTTPTPPSQSSEEPESESVESEVEEQEQPTFYNRIIVSTFKRSKTLTIPYEDLASGSGLTGSEKANILYPLPSAGLKKHRKSVVERISSDQAKLTLAEKRNNLESAIYSLREKIAYDDDVAAVFEQCAAITDVDAKKKLSHCVATAEDILSDLEKDVEWLTENADATVSDIEKRLKTVEKRGADLLAKAKSFANERRVLGKAKRAVKQAEQAMKKAKNLNADEMKAVAELASEMKQYIEANESTNTPLKESEVDSKAKKLSTEVKKMQTANKKKTEL